MEQSPCNPAGDGPGGFAPFEIVAASDPQYSSAPLSFSGYVGAFQAGACTDCAGVELLQPAYTLQIIDNISWNCQSTLYSAQASSGYFSDTSGNGNNNFIYVQLLAIPLDPQFPIGADNPWINCYFNGQGPNFYENDNC